MLLSCSCFMIKEETFLSICCKLCFFSHGFPVIELLEVLFFAIFYKAPNLLLLAGL